MRRLFFLLICIFAAAVSATPAAQSSSPAGVALFDEVWKTINDQFYDPTFGGLDWPGVRDELRPKAAAATTIDAARAVVNEMLGRLKRSHFALLPGSASADDDMALRGEATVDIEFRVLGGDVVITRDRSEVQIGPAGRLTGRRILAIDGRNIVPAPGTPPLMTWRRVNAALHGAEGSIAVVVLAPVDSETAIVRMPATARLPRRILPGVPVQFGNLPPMRVRVEQWMAKTPAGRGVGVIGFNIWMAQIDDPVASAVDAFRAADGLIFDLRGNPGGLAGMISNLAGHVLDRADLIGTMRVRQSPQLKFIANPRTTTVDGRTVKPYGGPLAILVDEMTASASECFAGGLQDLGRARIFGRTSMGQALPASTRRLSNGDVLEYVIGDFVTSKGRSLEGSGVVPDEIQPLSTASLLAGNDDPMRAALAWIDRQSRPVR
jgi:carboxyl-terminal processing protease